MEQHQGNYDKARQLYNESLDIDRKLGDQSGIAITIAQLGVLAGKQDNPALAEKNYQEALRIFEKLGEKPHLEVTMSNLERVRQKIHEQHVKQIKRF